MKVRSLPTCILIALTGFGSYLSAQSFDFNDATTGNLDRQVWAQTWLSDSEQQNLFQVVEGVGVDGTRGLSLKTQVAGCGYRFLLKVPLQGKELEIRSKFRVGLGNGRPPKPNYPLIGVYFNSTDTWYKGDQVDFLLTRGKVDGKQVGGFGLSSSIEKGLPLAAIKGEALGFPSALPAAGETVMSDWLILKLKLSPVGGLWNLECMILDESGEMIEGFRGEGLELPKSYKANKPIYAGIKLGWSGTREDKLLKEGGVTAVHVDDIQVKVSK